MLCAIPDGKSFKVQVKGISNANGFYIDKSFFEGDIQRDLFLVVVLVPPVGDSSQLRFLYFLTLTRKANSRKCPHPNEMADRSSTAQDSIGVQ